MKTISELEAEAEKLFPIYPKMCAWKKAQAEWKRREWVAKELEKIK